jgi:MFS family permease
MIDRVGRRKLFVSMAIGMCIVLVSEAICVAVGGYSASIAAVFFVFMFEACFTWGWMATVWIYPAEILPLKIRAKGAALAAAADFLGNFLVVEITPSALANIGYKTYIIFAVFNIVNAIIVWCFYPETAGQTLESIDFLFAKDDDGFLDDERDRWYRKLQWEMVARAARARNLRRRAVSNRESLGSTVVADEDLPKATDERVERTGQRTS